MSSRVGLIARADNRGLGQQTWAFYRHMQPAKTLVVDCNSAQPLELHLDRYPGAAVTSNGFPTRAEIETFLDGLDVVYTAETGYGNVLWNVARENNIRTVLHVNYEFWVETDDPTTLVAPTSWHIDELPTGTTILPVPIETDRLTVHKPKRLAERFLHIVGRPAIHDRNGTPELFAALEYVRSTVTVIVACQQRGYVEEIQRNYRIPDNVTVEVRSNDVENYWDNYLDADVLIMPRRFGGLCLPAQEATGCGIPVIMPDISPNEWLVPPNALVPADWMGSFQAKQPVDYYRSDPLAIADRIDTFASSPYDYAQATWHALTMREVLSWDRLHLRYRRLFG